MARFKLLAIVPLAGCDKKIRKNLEIGSIYKFHENYSIKTSSNDDDIIYAKNEGDKTIELYNCNKISINIHSVVGGNGSGKSSIFELYYYFIYILGCTHNLDENKDAILSFIDKELLYKNNLLKSQIEYFNKLIEIPIKLKRKGKKIIPKQHYWEILKISNDHNIEISIKDIIDNKFNINHFHFQLINKEQEYGSILESQQNNFEKIRQQLNCSIIYELDNVIYSLTYINKQLSFFKFDDNGNKIISKLKFELENYFYTVSLNYSHHSLNSLSIGDWVNKLFHKNDAYITPVVINPMRNEGNFNINDELHLSKERIMMNIISNLLKEKDFKLLGKYRVKAIVYSLKNSISPISDFKIKKNISKETLYTEVSNLDFQFKDPKKDYSLIDYSIGYLNHKIKKLKQHYGHIFIDDKTSLNSENEIKEQLEKVTKNLFLNDNSHITKKINQTINFIQNFKSSFWKIRENTDNRSKEIDVVLDTKQVENWVKKCNSKYKNEDSFNLSVIAHPGIFNLDFILEDLNGTELNFKDLSSGEQQLIFNINTIIYHLNNLNSIHNESGEYVLKRPKYKHLNIVLDEIELYYHPEYQRKFIKTLIDEIEKFASNINSKYKIDSLNICFLTHSPFILSDIPAQNILRLENGKPSDKEFSETFGANIHNLLANDFFLNKGFMGEFAKGKINEIIQYLTFELNKKEIDVFEKNPKLENFEKSKLSYLKKFNKKIENDLKGKNYDITQVEKIIHQIGEPLIKDKLFQMRKLI